MLDQIIKPGLEAWTVADVPERYENSRGGLLAIEDRGGNLVHLNLMGASDDKRGDDVSFQETAERYGTIEYEFFVRPPPHLIGMPMTREVAIDCYRYDPTMVGKIRKLPIADQVLTEHQLTRTILDPRLSLDFTHTREYVLHSKG
tara:strand:- start:232 stop:666 length:435 start_codon:yes stop_codon:yes gene_type:complete